MEKTPQEAFDYISEIIGNIQKEMDDHRDHNNENFINLRDSIKLILLRLEKLEKSAEQGSNPHDYVLRTHT